MYVQDLLNSVKLWAMGEGYKFQPVAESVVKTSTDNINKPFYLRGGAIRDELEMNLSILNPQQKEQYGKVEDAVSKQFVQMYGKYMNPEQIAYFEGRQFIYTNYEMADKFGEVWEQDIVSVHPEISEIDGKVYTRYSVGKSVEEDTTSKTSAGSIIRQYWAGRFAVYPLSQEELTDVDPKWLISESTYDNLGDIRKETEAEYRARSATLGPYVYTNSLGAVAVHEKVHGIQDYELPLPLLEGAAHYYQLAVAKSNGWEAKIGNNMEQFAKLYEQFIEEFGDNAHRLLFGNIEDEKTKETLLKRAKEIFNEEAILKASKHHDFDWWETPWNYINWETHPVDDVKAELLLKTLEMDIVESSGELGFSPAERKFIIGRRVLEASKSEDEYRRLGAEKRFTHEFWHFTFAELSKSEQSKLLSDFRTKIAGDTSLSEDVSNLCGLLYSEDSYQFHFPTGEDDHSLFVNGDSLGIKDDTLVGIPNDGREVFGAYLLTEILSFASEGEFVDIDQYYSAVKPKDNPAELLLWERKRQFGILARNIISSLEQNVINSKFRSRTKEGIALLHKIADLNSD